MQISKDDSITNIHVMAIISVPKPLRDKLGEEGSDALISLMNQQSESAKGDVIEIAGEKFERRLSEEMAKVNERFSEVNERITEETSRLDVKISESHTNLIKWMFIFWIGQVGALLAILFAFFKWGLSKKNERPLHLTTEEKI